MSFQGSFTNGVVSAVPLRETIDFTGFSGTFQDIAVAHEKHSKHIKNSFRKVINCRVLPQFAFSFDYTYIVKSITKRVKCGKSRQIEAINRSKNVVRIDKFYYATIIFFSKLFIVSC